MPVPVISSNENHEPSPPCLQSSQTRDRFGQFKKIKCREVASKQTLHEHKEGVGRATKLSICEGDLPTSELLVENPTMEMDPAKAGDNYKTLRSYRSLIPPLASMHRDGAPGRKSPTSIS